MLSDVRLLLRLLSCPMLLARVLALSAAPTVAPTAESVGCLCTEVESECTCVCGAGHVLDMCSGGGSLDPAAAHESDTVVQLITRILSKVQLSGYAYFNHTSINVTAVQYSTVQLRVNMSINNVLSFLY